KDFAKDSAEYKVAVALKRALVRVLETRRFTTDDAQALVLEVARIAVEQKNKDLQVALAVAAECQARPRGCSVAEIAQLLADPQAQFSDAPAAGDWLKTEGVHFVSAVLHVLE